MVSSVGGASPYPITYTSPDAVSYSSGGDNITQVAQPPAPPAPTDSSDSSSSSDTTPVPVSTNNYQPVSNQYYYSSQSKYTPQYVPSWGYTRHTIQQQPYKKADTYNNPPVFQSRVTPHFTYQQPKPEVLQPELFPPKLPPVARQQDVPRFQPTVRQQDVPNFPPALPEQHRQEIQRPNPFMMDSVPSFPMPSSRPMMASQPVNPMLVSMMTSASKPQPSGQGHNWTQGLFSGIMDNYFGGQTPSSSGITATAGLQFTSGY